MPAPLEPSPAPLEPSPLVLALDRVGDRWSLLIVDALLAREARFTELTEALPGIAPNILTDRLRRLERERIVVSTPYQQHPPRMAYALTADGRALASAIRLLTDWGAGHLDDAALRHATCGTRLEARWYCPTCATLVDGPDAAEADRSL